MAIVNSRTKELFIDKNIYSDPIELIEWIIELLPQDVFDGYIKHIFEELGDE